MSWIQSLIWPFGNLTDAALTAAVALVVAVAAGAVSGYWKGGSDNLRRFEEKR